PRRRRQGVRVQASDRRRLLCGDVSTSLFVGFARRELAEAGVLPLVVVVVGVGSDSGPGGSQVVVGVQVDVLVLQAPPEALDVDVVAPTAFAVHADLNSTLLQDVGEGAGSELRALIGVHNLRWSEALQGFA